MNIVVQTWPGSICTEAVRAPVHDPESDADVAVILSKDFDFWREVSVLSDLSYDYLAEQNVCIDAKPAALLEWNDPSSRVNPSLVRAMRIARPSEQNLE